MRFMMMTAFCLILATGTGIADEDFFNAFYALYNDGQYEKALDLANKAIAKEGENYDLLTVKYNALSALERYSDALKIALKKDELCEQQSSWNCLDIADCYLYLENGDQALDWMEKAVDRGFIDYLDLRAGKYDLIRDDTRFAELERAIKDKIGIGQPANDFTVTLLNGKPFTLSEQTGKVVLVDFWSTQCGPCREEAPNLKNIYLKFARKGLVIIGISLDYSREELDSFIRENRLRWKISFSGQGWADETVKLYGVNSIPSMWLVDRNGILRHFGLRGEELKEVIADMLNHE
jgi:peroxiredoxin